MLEPGVSGDGGLAAVAVVVEQLLALLDVPGRHQDQVRNAADVVQLRLTVTGLAVVDEPAEAARLPGGVNAETRTTSR